MLRSVARLPQRVKALPPLSQQMLEFIRPDFPSSDDLPSDKTGYTFYVLAWNLAVLQIDSRPVAMVNRHIEGFPPHLRRIAEQRLVELIDRKRQMFRDDPRVVAECRPITEAGVTKLQVAWVDDASHLNRRNSSAS